jgi:hypothetical protein
MIYCIIDITIGFDISKSKLLIGNNVTDNTVLLHSHNRLKK